MAIAFANTGASTVATPANPDFSIGTDLASYANTAWTPPTSGVIICFVYNAKATAADAVTSVTGNSLTWVNLATATFGASNIKRLSMFMADAAPAVNGITTVSFGANVQIGCNASFFQATGVDITGGIAVGAGKAVIQAPVVSLGASATSGSVTLAAAASANNRPIACFGSVTSESMVPRASWTTMDLLGGSAPTRDLITEVRSDAFETTASATWTTAGVWGAIAAELNATAGGGGGIVVKNLSALGVG